MWLCCGVVFRVGLFGVSGLCRCVGCCVCGVCLMPLFVCVAVAFDCGLVWRVGGVLCGCVDVLMCVFAVAMRVVVVCWVCIGVMCDRGVKCYCLVIIVVVIAWVCAFWC